MSITVSGMDEFFKIGDRLATMQMLEPPMQRSLYRLEAYMKHYPAVPPLSRYVRKGTLGRRWLTAPIERRPDGLVGRIGNNTEYGPYVQSERFQTRWHRRTGWRTDEQAVEQNEAAIVADFRQAIEQALAG